MERRWTGPKRGGVRGSWAVREGLLPYVWGREYNTWAWVVSQCIPAFLRHGLPMGVRGCWEERKRTISRKRIQYEFVYIGTARIG